MCSFDTSKSKSSVFELFKQKRRDFLNRRNIVSNLENIPVCSGKKLESLSDLSSVRTLNTEDKHEREFESRTCTSKDELQCNIKHQYQNLVDKKDLKRSFNKCDENTSSKKLKSPVSETGKEDMKKIFKLPTKSRGKSPNTGTVQKDIKQKLKIDVIETNEDFTKTPKTKRNHGHEFQSSQFVRRIKHKLKRLENDKKQDVSVTEPVDKAFTRKLSDWVADTSVENIKKILKTAATEISENNLNTETNEKDVTENLESAVIETKEHITKELKMRVFKTKAGGNTKKLKRPVADTSVEDIKKILKTEATEISENNLNTEPNEKDVTENLESAVIETKEHITKELKTRGFETKAGGNTKKLKRPISDTSVEDIKKILKTAATEISENNLNTETNEKDVTENLESAVIETKEHITKELKMRVFKTKAGGNTKKLKRPVTDTSVEDIKKILKTAATEVSENNLNTETNEKDVTENLESAVIETKEHITKELKTRGFKTKAGGNTKKLKRPVAESDKNSRRQEFCKGDLAVIDRNSCKAAKGLFSSSLLNKNWTNISSTTKGVNPVQKSTSKITLNSRKIITVVRQSAVIHNERAKSFSKYCKWCHTPFTSNEIAEIMCIICRDLGRGNKYNSKLRKKHKQEKHLKKSAIAKKRGDGWNILKKQYDTHHLTHSKKAVKMVNDKECNKPRVKVTSIVANDKSNTNKNNLLGNKVLPKKVSDETFERKKSKECQKRKNNVKKAFLSDKRKVSNLQMKSSAEIKVLSSRNEHENKTDKSFTDQKSIINSEQDCDKKHAVNEYREGDVTPVASSSLSREETTLSEISVSNAQIPINVSNQSSSNLSTFDASFTSLHNSMHLSQSCDKFSMPIINTETQMLDTNESAVIKPSALSQADESCDNFSMPVFNTETQMMNTNESVPIITSAISPADESIYQPSIQEIPLSPDNNLLPSNNFFNFEYTEMKISSVSSSACKTRQNDELIITSIRSLANESTLSRSTTSLNSKSLLSDGFVNFENSEIKISSISSNARKVDKFTVVNYGSLENGEAIAEYAINENKNERIQTSEGTEGSAVLIEFNNEVSARSENSAMDLVPKIVDCILNENSNNCMKCSRDSSLVSTEADLKLLIDLLKMVQVTKQLLNYPILKQLEEQHVTKYVETSEKIEESAVLKIFQITKQLLNYPILKQLEEQHVTKCVETSEGIEENALLNELSSEISVESENNPLNAVTNADDCILNENCNTSDTNFNMNSFVSTETGNKLPGVKIVETKECINPSILEPQNGPALTNHVLHQNSISAVSYVLDVMCALAIFDLTENPQLQLNGVMQREKLRLETLGKELENSEYNVETENTSYRLDVLNSAKLWSSYGSFEELSDMITKRKDVHLKKDIHSDIVNHSSSNSPQSFETDNSQYSCFQTTAATQVLSKVPFSECTSSNSVVVAPTPGIPERKCIKGETGENSNRNECSTPAGPENSALQLEQQSSIKIKEEQLDSSNSVPSQSLYSQNLALSDVSDQAPHIQEIPSSEYSYSSAGTTTLTTVLPRNECISNGISVSSSESKECDNPARLETRTLQSAEQSLIHIHDRQPEKGNLALSQCSHSQNKELNQFLSKLPFLTEQISGNNQNIYNQNCSGISEKNTVLSLPHSVQNAISSLSHQRRIPTCSNTGSALQINKPQNTIMTNYIQKAYPSTKYPLRNSSLCSETLNCKNPWGQTTSENIGPRAQNTFYSENQFRVSAPHSTAYSYFSSLNHPNVNKSPVCSSSFKFYPHGNTANAHSIINSISSMFDPYLNAPPICSANLVSQGNYSQTTIQSTHLLHTSVPSVNHPHVNTLPPCSSSNSLYLKHPHLNTLPVCSPASNSVFSVNHPHLSSILTAPSLKHPPENVCSPSSSTSLHLSRAITEPISSPVVPETSAKYPGNTSPLCSLSDSATLKHPYVKTPPVCLSGFNTGSSVNPHINTAPVCPATLVCSINQPQTNTPSMSSSVISVPSVTQPENASPVCSSSISVSIEHAHMDAPPVYSFNSVPPVNPSHVDTPLISSPSYNSVSIINTPHVSTSPVFSTGHNSGSSDNPSHINTPPGCSASLLSPINQPQVNTSPVCSSVTPVPSVIHPENTSPLCSSSISLSLEHPNVDTPPVCSSNSMSPINHPHVDSLPVSSAGYNSKSSVNLPHLDTPVSTYPHVNTAPQRSLTNLILSPNYPFEKTPANLPNVGAESFNSSQVIQTALTCESNRLSYTPDTVHQPYFFSGSPMDRMPHNIFFETTAAPPYRPPSTRLPHSTCIVCGKPAMMWCKQCSRVSYCTTYCAKYYWRLKHHLECMVF